MINRDKSKHVLKKHLMNADIVPFKCKADIKVLVQDAILV